MVSRGAAAAREARAGWCRFVRGVLLGLLSRVAPAFAVCRGCPRLLLCCAEMHTAALSPRVCLCATPHATASRRVGGSRLRVVPVLLSCSSRGSRRRSPSVARRPRMGLCRDAHGGVRAACASRASRRTRLRCGVLGVRGCESSPCSSCSGMRRRAAGWSHNVPVCAVGSGRDMSHMRAGRPRGWRARGIRRVRAARSFNVTC